MMDTQAPTPYAGVRGVLLLPGLVPGIFYLSGLCTACLSIKVGLSLLMAGRPPGSATSLNWCDTLWVSGGIAAAFPLGWETPCAGAGYVSSRLDRHFRE